MIASVIRLNRGPARTQTTAESIRSFTLMAPLNGVGSSLMVGAMCSEDEMSLSAPKKCCRGGDEGGRPLMNEVRRGNRTPDTSRNSVPLRTARFMLAQKIKN